MKRIFSYLFKATKNFEFLVYRVEKEMHLDKDETQTSYKNFHIRKMK